MRSEAQLIERIARAIPSQPARGAGASLRLGIGDDGAILAPNRGFDWVLSCDQFLEGTHFLADVHPPDSVGYKSLVRAASDLTAMGATPRLFLLTIALPPARTARWLDRFLQGMGKAARLLGMRLAGGDTSKARLITMSITVLGDVARGKAVRRSGAHPGDIIYVSGKLGRAQLGLELIERGVGNQRRFTELLRPHLYPRIRLSLARWLAEHKISSAMMDLSDGLSNDLARLTSASCAGARIYDQRIPCATIPVRLSKRIPKFHHDPLQMALHGGEDYELLFTVPRPKVGLLGRRPESSELTAIGEITRDGHVLLVGPDGKSKRLVPQGWDPFRKG